jgi:rod shape-determining protein MreB
MLAIDLGTANTVIGAVGEGVLLEEPSVVAVAEGTRRIVSSGCAVGRLARQMLGRTPDSINVVRPLAYGVVADFELCEAMLRYFLRKVQRSRWGLKPKAIMAVPGSITPVEKRALYNSALRAGVRQVYLLPEAVAAAVGVGLPVTEPLASMVCDIGGGDTEVAVLSLGDVVAAKSIRVAGDAMDRAIVDFLRRQYAMKIGLASAEQLKLDLGSAAPLDEELALEVRGVDAVSGLPRRATLTSEEVRLALEEPLAAIVDAIRAVLDQTSPDLASDLVEHGLVLSGAGSQLRGLDRYLTERTGLPARVSPDATVAAAQGCLICLEQLEHWRGRMETSDQDV